MNSPCGVPQISVVIPCHDEAAAVGRTLRELRPHLLRTGCPFEIIVVDDGSTDATPRILRAAARRLPQLRVLSHPHRRGEAAPMLTGLRHARGSILVTMDADGQHDPAHLPRLLQALDGADAVCPVWSRTAHPPGKRLPSRLWNALRAVLMRDGLRDVGVTYRVLRREALEGLPRFRGLHRFLPCILRQHGWRVVQPAIAHRPRRGGRSKYGFRNRLGPALLDLLGMLWYQRRHLPPAPEPQ